MLLSRSLSYSLFNYSFCCWRIEFFWFSINKICCSFSCLKCCKSTACRFIFSSRLLIYSESSMILVFCPSSSFSFTLISCFEIPWRFTVSSNTWVWLWNSLFICSSWRVDYLYFSSRFSYYISLSFILRISYYCFSFSYWMSAMLT